MNRCDRPLAALFALLAMFSCPMKSVGQGLALTNVTGTPTSLEAGSGQLVTVRFNLTRAAEVTLFISDARGIVVWRSASRGFGRGDGAISWSGVGVNAQSVPPGAYTYRLEARAGADAVVHDLTQVTGGQPLTVSDIRFDEDRHVIRYRLAQNGRVFVRAGIERGPVMKTIANGVVREAGLVEEPWDGRDVSRVVDVGGHPELQLSVEGYRLSRNTIIVRGPQRPQANWLDPGDTTGSVTSQGREQSRGLNRHAHHNPAFCRDPALVLSLPFPVSTNDDGIAILNQVTSFRINLAAQDESLLDSKRFEVVYFLDNHMLHEQEINYLPYTWNWNPGDLGPGIHYLTAFIVTFDGHYAVATLPFVTSVVKVRGEPSNGSQRHAT